MHPVPNVFSKLQVVRGIAMKVERRFVGINLDQEEEAGIVNLLVDVEPMASWFRVAGDARVT